MKASLSANSRGSQPVACPGQTGRRKFPNLFIIGAMKAGTSSLHEYLHQHPEIFMSRWKEPQYFAPHTTRWGHRWGQGNPYPEPGEGWYFRLFEDAGDVKYAGESSVSYTARPWVSDCEKRIWEFNPDARLIYILRDPAERAISHYWHFVADGREDRDMLTAFRKRPDYVARSNYAMQLRPYLDTFGRDRVFLLTSEELDANPRPVLRRLFEWLSVDPNFEVDTQMRFNVTRDEFLQTRRGRVFLDTFLKGSRWRRIEPHLPTFIPRLLKRVTYRTVLRQEVATEPAVRYLRSVLREPTHELAELVGREFAEWETLHGSDS